MVTALVLLFGMRAADAEQRIRTDLLAELLARRGTGTADRALAERGRVLGLRLLAPHVVAVCRCTARPRGLLVAAARCGDGRGLAGEHDGVVVALLPGQDASAVADALARRLGEDGTEVTVGGAGPVVPAAGLAAAYAEARRICDAMVALGMTGRGGSVRELGFAGLVASPRADVEAYLRRVLGPLLDYDERRGSALVATLEEYFAAGASPRRAAAELHVHVNTVAQRLERVTALLGEGWQLPDQALDIQLALRLLRLRAGGDG
jgi:sugar diacid utilization regulator